MWPVGYHVGWHNLGDHEVPRGKRSRSRPCLEGSHWENVMMPARLYGEQEVNIYCSNIWEAVTTGSVNYAKW